MLKDKIKIIYKKKNKPLFQLKLIREKGLVKYPCFLKFLLIKKKSKIQDMFFCFGNSGCPGQLTHTTTNPWIH